MGLLIVGSLALDDIETPFDKVTDALGGSTTYISITASYFTSPIHIVGVIGEDFPKEHIKLLEDYKIDLQGMQTIEGGKTFRWGGRYHDNFNERDTLYTHLNVFEHFNPVIPESLRNSEYVLLGNIDPVLQLNVLDQMNNPEFVVCDSMNLWINIRKKELLEVMKRINILVINDSEAKMLAEESNLIKAAEWILKSGPEHLIIKKGEHGAMLFSEGKVFSAPAFPLSSLYDPTGAGDTFAGGFTGYLHKTKDLSFENMKKAVAYGSVMGSFCVEQFSTKAIEGLDKDKINQRFSDFRRLALFEDNKL